MLTLALTAHEDSMCSGCGHPKDATYNPDAEGWYEAREVTCAGCKAQQERGQIQSKGPQPGAKLYVVDTRPPGQHLRAWSMTSGSDDQSSDYEGDSRKHE